MTESAAAGGIGRRRISWAQLLPWVRTVLRVGLGGVWIAAGALKIGDPAQSVQAVAAYELLPQSLNQLVGWGLPYLEILLGLVLVSGFFTRWSAAASGLLQLVFITGLLSAWSRGLSIDCGCFTSGGQVDPSDTSYGLSLLRDIGFTLAAAWLVWKPYTRLSADGATGAFDRTDEESA